MAVTRDDVFQALRGIPEPCSIAMDVPESLVSMGLIESIEIDGAHVGVSLVLTDPSCVHFVSMRRFITDTLTRLDGVEVVHVRMSTTRLWTPDLMNPTGPPEPVAPASVGRTLLPMAR